jgi:hypothetical protein
LAVINFEQPFAQQVEYSGGLIYLQGLAMPGTNTGSPAWQIKKLVYDDSSMMTQVLFASGTDQFCHKWTERGSGVYQ